MDNPLKTFLDKAGYTTNPEVGDIRMYLAGLVQVALTLVGIILFVLIFYSGFMWLTAGGNEEQIKKARSRMIGALIGFIIVVVSLGITRLIVSWISAAAQ